MYAYMCARVCAYMCTCVCAYVCACVCVCVYMCNTTTSRHPASMNTSLSHLLRLAPALPAAARTTTWNSYTVSFMRLKRLGRNFTWGELSKPNSRSGNPSASVQFPLRRRLSIAHELAHDQRKSNSVWATGHTKELRSVTQINKYLKQVLQQIGSE